MTDHKHEFVWKLNDCNETGWHCLGCDHKPGEPPGYSPHLDRSHTDEKIASILMSLHMQDFVYVSNGTEGADIEVEVARRCHRDAAFDQLSIIGFIVDELGRGGKHAAYWREIGEGVISGNDKRNRCACGALATCASCSADGWVHRCSACSSRELDAEIAARPVLTPEELAAAEKAESDAWAAFCVPCMGSGKVDGVECDECEGVTFEQRMAAKDGA